MLSKPSNTIQDLLSNSGLFLELERSAPFGYWIYDLEQDSLILSNSLRLLLLDKDQSNAHFRSMALGEIQLEQCISLYKAGVKELTLNYVGTNQVYRFKAEVSQAYDYPDLLLIKHLDQFFSPFPSDPYNYAYLIKIDQDGLYSYSSKSYLDVFIEKGRNIVGDDALLDVLPHSRQDCAEAAGTAMAKPGSTTRATLEKRAPDGRILTTAWEFVALPEGLDRLMLYARGYDVSSLRKAQKQIHRDQKELEIFFNSGLSGVAFVMLEEPREIESIDLSEAGLKAMISQLSISRVNKVFADQMGLSGPDEALGSKILEITGIEEGYYLAHLNELLGKGRVEFQAEKIRPDGSAILLDLQQVLLKDEEEKLLGLLIMQQDVTESMRHRELFINSSYRLKKLTESIPGIVFQLEACDKGRISLPFLSEAYEQTQVDLSREELLKNPASILDKIGPKDYSTVLGSILYASRNKEELDLDFRIENKLGEEQWYRVNARPEQVESNRSSWYGIVHSIDAQKEFEQKEFKLAQIARSTSDLILVVDAEGRIDWVNASASEYFQWELGEVLKKKPHQLLHSNDDEPKLKEFLSAIDNQRGINIKLKLQARNAVRWLQVRNKPIWNANGEFLFSLVVMQDIDQEETKNLEMESLLNLTSEQNKRLQSFTYIISHNIRSHSANLQGLIETIEASESEEEKEELWSYLKQVSEGLESTIKHLNQIIVINQSLNKNKQWLNLKEEVNRVMKIVGREVQALEASIIMDFDPDQEILAVKAYLESILMNLITNALRYRHPERKPTIKINCKRKKGLLFVYLKDNGLGIDLKKHRNRLFQLYQTFHDNPNSRGLGLYILKSQVDSMGGEVKVESAPGEGSTFSFGLPTDIQK